MASFLTKIFRLIIVFCNLRYRLQRIRLLLQSAQISTLQCDLIVGYLINFDLQGQSTPFVRSILIYGKHNYSCMVKCKPITFQIISTTTPSAVAAVILRIDWSIDSLIDQSFCDYTESVVLHLLRRMVVTLCIYSFIALRYKCWRSAGLLVLQTKILQIRYVEKVSRKEKKVPWLDLGSLEPAA